MAREALLRVTPAAGDGTQYRFELHSPYDSRPVVVTEFHSIGDVAALLRLSRGLSSTVLRHHRWSMQGLRAVDGSLQEAIRRFGQILFDQLLPRRIAAAVRELPEGAPLILSTSDATVPWELLHDGDDFLVMKLELARWLMVNRGVRSDASRLRADDRQPVRPALLIASDPDGNLPHAIEEVTFLEDVLSGPFAPSVLGAARALPALFRKEWEAGTYSIVHYSGHALPATADRPACLVLAGGEALCAGQLPVAEGGPVVFLNACHSADESLSGDLGATVPVEFVYNGLASGFVEAGARAVVGTLWPVSDTGAQVFAEAFYRRALEGASFGQALAAARRDALRWGGADDPTWASYVFYGNPQDGLFPAPVMASGKLPHLLTIADAAAYLGLPYRELFRWVKARQLHSQNVDGKCMVLGEEVNALKASAMRNGEATLAVRVTTDAEVRCARCGRLLRESGPPTCQEPGCNAPICKRCWQQEDDRFCRVHAMTPGKRLARERERLATGEIPLLVTADEARLAEDAFLERFDQRVRAQRTIRIEPGAETAVRDWARWHSLDVLAGSPRPDAQCAWAVQALPQNRVSRYMLPRGHAAVIEAAVVHRLDRLAEMGFDTQPLGRDELTAALKGRETELDDAVLCMLGFASPVGWDDEAIALVDAGQEGRSFWSDHLVPLLVDLRTGRVHFNRFEPRAAAVEYLFRPVSLEEELHGVRCYIEQELVDHLTLEDVSKTLQVPTMVVKEAFEMLARQNRYRLSELPGTGWVISLAY